MKIKALRTTRLRMPFVEPPATGFLPLTHREFLIVDVELDNGFCGMGYLHPLVPGLRTLETCVHEMIKPLVLGESLVDGDGAPRIEALWDRLFQATYLHGRMGISVMAQSAVDVALWDALGRALEKPLFALWGGSARPIPVYGSGCFRGLGPDGMVRKARGYVERGFSAIKMQVAHLFDAQADIRNVGAMREALGDNIAIMVDVNQGWDAEQAILIGGELEPYEPAWLEEPVVAHDLEGYERVARGVNIPIVGGENHFTHLDLMPFIERRALAMVQPDVMRGGLTDLRKTAELTAAALLPLAPHLFPELMTHLAASVPNVAWLEYMGWQDDCWIDPVLPVAGFMEPPARPGHGLRFRPELIRRFTVS